MYGISEFEQQISGQDGYKELRLKNIENQINSLECDHPKTETRYLINKNNKKMYTKQCLKCGTNVGGWISHDKIDHRNQYNLVDENLKKIYWENRSNLYNELTKLKQEIERDNFFKGYDVYLQSEQWKEKRRLVINRCGGICEGCRKKNVTQVHHLTYRNWGNEFLFELVGLCYECHQRIHSKVA